MKAFARSPDFRFVLELGRNHKANIAFKYFEEAING